MTFGSGPFVRDVLAKNLNKQFGSEVCGLGSGEEATKFAHISITLLPTPIISPHIRANQTLNRPNMPKKYRGW